MKKTDLIEFCSIEDIDSIQELLSLIFDLSKNQIKKYKLNKNFLKKEVRAQDVVSIPINMANRGAINPQFTGTEPKSLFEDDVLLALSKPERIHCHPLTYNENNNLLSYLLSKDQYKFDQVNCDNYDRGLMYRLDYETSGLVIFFKNNDDYQFMRENFQKIVKEKIYYAAVSGCYDGERDLQHMLRPSGPGGAKIIADKEHTADTKFSRIKLLEVKYDPDHDTTLLKIQLTQGHRHQIRAQMRATGFPLIGDKLYGGENAPRLYLHCYRYSFHLNGKDYDLVDESVSFLSEFFRPNS